MGGEKYEVPITDETQSISPYVDSWWLSNSLGLHQYWTYNIFENIKTGWKERVWQLADDTTGWEILDRAPLVTYGNVMSLDSPVALTPHQEYSAPLGRMVTSATFDLNITGKLVTINTSDSKNLVVNVDGQAYTFDPNTTSSVLVNGSSAGSTLTIDDHLHATGTFMAYGIDQRQVTENGLSIAYNPSVENVVLCTSDKVAGSVDVGRTSPLTKVFVNAGAAATTINASLHVGVQPLLSDLTVTGNSKTTINTYDNGAAEPTIYAETSSVREDGVAGKLLFNAAIGSVRVYGNDHLAHLNVVSHGTTPLTLVGGSGETTFVVGNWLNGLDTVAGLVSVVGGTGHGVLTVDDSAGSATSLWKQYNVDSQSVATATTRVVYDPAVSQAIVKTANKLDSHVEVDGSAAATPLEVDMGAKGSQVQVYFDNVNNQQLLGNVQIVGNGQTNLSTFDYTSRDQVYDLQDGSVYGYDRAKVSYANIKSLTVNGGTGNDTFGLGGSTAGVTTDVNGWSGPKNCFVVMGNDGTLNNAFHGPLNLHGASGITSGAGYIAFADYYNTTRQSYTLSANQLTGSNIAPITWDKMFQVGFQGSLYVGADINVTGVASGTTLIADLGYAGFPSQDTLTIGRPLGNGKSTLADLKGDLLINVYEGSQKIVVDDSGDTTTHQATSAKTDYGIALKGLSQGGIYFNGITAAGASKVTLKTAPGKVTGVDSFFALLGT